MRLDHLHSSFENVSLENVLGVINGVVKLHGEHVIVGYCGTDVLYRRRIRVALHDGVLVEPELARDARHEVRVQVLRVNDVAQLLAVRFRVRLFELLVEWVLFADEYSIVAACVALL